MSFRFEGKAYQGYKGDTLASALAANGQKLLSRSFKYHRPRGGFTFAGLDGNTYVQVGDEPNVPADAVQIYEQLTAYGQNYVGSLHHDFLVHIGHFSRFLPVGFYYRAFFRPKGIWQMWEPIFRRVAGLGRISPNTNRIYFDKQYLFADVAVIGSGPAGLSAALSAAGEGKDVLLLEQEPLLGGSLNYARFQQEPSSVSTLRSELVERVRLSSNIRVLTDATCVGWFADNWLSICSSSRLYKLRTGFVIACTGSVEQPMVFRNNDLPGVLPASGVQRLLRLYGVRPGNQAVIATANPDGYDVALDLLEAGISVVAVVDLNECTDSSVVQRILSLGIAVYEGCTITEAIPGPGMRCITGVVITRLLELGDPTTDAWCVDCDLLVTSVGYAPLGQLACHCGGELHYDDRQNSFVVRNLPPNSRHAGSVNHQYTLSAVIEDGRMAGLYAARGDGPAVKPSDESINVNHPYPIFEHAKGNEFVDFDEDQTVADLRNSIADGFDHPELAKRYTTIGMGPSQGRLSSLNTLRIIRKVNSGARELSRVTTQRPPFKPVSFGILAGRSLQPVRLTPIHYWHIDNGAALIPTGLWQRPAYYGSECNRESMISDEVAAIRRNVGVIDVSSLGGIEVRGPDAAEFLNRLYTFTYNDLPTGRLRYVLMLDETGGIIDDGVAGRLTREHFYVTTTTTGSDATYRSMLRRNAEWCLDIDISNVSSTYAGINIAGPNSRKVLEMIDSDIDFTKGAFPYFALREGQIAGTPVMALRVGFVGELGYELHVPWSNALALWEKLFVAGQDFNIRPVGVEAQRILRLEKGHIIVGQDTDGLTLPGNAALGWAVSASKPYFTGRRAITYAATRPATQHLVGFKLLNQTDPMPQECNLVVDGDAIIGRVTSVARSQTLNQVIGLAYVPPEKSKPESAFEIRISDKSVVSARTTQTPFYDPKNLKQAE